MGGVGFGFEIFSHFPRVFVKYRGVAGKLEPVLRLRVET